MRRGPGRLKYEEPSVTYTLPSRSRARRPTRHRAQDADLLHRALGGEPAAGDEDDLGLIRDDLLPLQRHGPLALAAEAVHAAARRTSSGSSGPWKTAGRATPGARPAAGCAAAACSTPPRPRARARGDRVGRALFRSGRGANLAHAFEHLVQRFRLEIEHARAPTAARTRRLHLVLGYRADVAQGLCHEEIGIERVSTSMSSEYSADCCTHALAHQRSISPLVASMGISVLVTFGGRSDRPWIVALVCHADQLILESELADDLGGAGQQ